VNFKEWFQSRKPAEPSQPDPEEAAQRDAEDAILTKLAAKVVEWKMTVPAILSLESVKPLNYIGAQTMVFFEPFIQTLFNLKDYDTVRVMLEKRENIERLLLKIEELDAVAFEKEKQAKAERIAARGHRWWWPFGSKSSPTDPPAGPPTPL
jgi:hypothetical protein